MATAFAKEGNGAVAKAAKTAIDEDVGALRKDIDSLRADVGALLKHSGKFADAKAREQLDKGVEVSKEAAGKASETMKSATHDVEERIRANPLAAVGIALGAGVALSMLARK